MGELKLLGRQQPRLDDAGEMKVPDARVLCSDWLGLISGRRSVRRYVGGRLDRSVIDQLMRAAGLAPSAHNRQPWRFVLLEDSSSKERLAASMGQKLRQDRLADGDDPAAVARDVERSYTRITAAPLIVVVCLSIEVMDCYPDERRRRAEYIMAVQSTAMATQNLLLAAHSLGLGACIMCAPLFCVDTVSNGLGLPAGWEPQGLVTLGHPAERGKDAVRRALTDFVWRPPGDGA
jgi:coenzyme F420-0:L-glutamate ligase / coenzyme F420-1:gamma-L-glutamate ligase